MASVETQKSQAEENRSETTRFKIEKFLAGVREDPYSSKYEPAYRQKMERILTLPVREQEKRIEEEEEYMADYRKMELLVDNRIVPQLEMMVREGTASEVGKRKLLFGVREGLINKESEELALPSGKDGRKMKLGFVEGEVKLLQKLHEENKRIKAAKDAGKTVLQESFSCNQEKISFFTDAEKKASDEIFTHQFGDYLDGKLADKYTPTTFLAAIETERKKRQKEFLERKTLYVAGQKPLDEMKRTFATLGKSLNSFSKADPENLVRAIPAFSRNFSTFTHFIGNSAGKGLIPAHFAHLAKIASMDLKAAQNGLAVQVTKKKKDAIEHEMDWKRSKLAHRELLQLFLIVPGTLLTPELRKEKMEAQKNIQKCDVEIPAEKMEEEVTKERKYAEKYLDWQESYELHTSLLSRLEAYGAEKTDGLKRERDLVEENLKICEDKIGIKKENGEIPEKEISVEDRDKLIEDMIFGRVENEENGDAIKYFLAYLMVAQDRKQHRDEGKMEIDETMTDEEVSKRHAEEILKEGNDTRDIQPEDHEEGGSHPIELIEEKDTLDGAHELDQLATEEQKKLTKAARSDIYKLSFERHKVHTKTTRETARSAIEAFEKGDAVSVSRGDDRNLSFLQTRDEAERAISHDLSEASAKMGIKEGSTREGVRKTLEKITRIGRTQARTVLEDVKKAG
ncbi:hypothetical protein HZA38_03160 [Candidatus Peregrinibacteria bacterium]|nr:hypothetical protein [Candidatus Peregrinibacteria bacterium]